MAGLCPLSISPAQAAQYNATVTFTAIQADTTGITLSGTVQNTGTDPLYKVQVVLWRDADTITTPSELQAVLALDPQADIGDRLAQASATVVIVTGDTAFGPGQTASFTVSTTWADAQIAQTGAYLVGVHVRACDNTWGPLVTIGWGRTLVTKTTEPVPTAAVVLLTSPPSLLHDNVFLDDHLASELTGRLLTLVTLASHDAHSGIAWLIDPALFHEISVMSQGYQVLSDTALVDGSGQAAAVNWLNAYKSLDQAAGYRLPWGNPDLALGAATGNTSLIANAQAAEAANSELSHLPLAVQAGNGLADDAFLSYVAPLQPAVVLAQVASSAMSGDIRILNTAPVAFPDGAGTNPADAGLQQVQRAQADDIVNPAPLVRIVSTAADAALTSQLLTLPVALTPLRSIPVTAAWTSELSKGAAQGPLTEAMTASVNAVGKAVNAYASLVNSPDSAQAMALLPMAALLSQSWPGDAAAKSYATAMEQWLQSLMTAVSLTATPEVSLTSRTALFPVTITNNLTVPAYVRVAARSVPLGSQPANLSIPTTEVQVVQPGDKMAITLSPTVVREGDAEARLQLTTQDGTAIGAPVTVTVNARASAWMGWAVVVAAFILFTVGTVLRVRTKRSHDPAAGEAPDANGGEQP